LSHSNFSIHLDDKIRILNCGYHIKKYFEEASTDTRDDTCFECMLAESASVLTKDISNITIDEK
jgi:hypothetical protein